MIRPLRERHRRFTLVLALLLPPLMAIAWIARPAAPPMDPLPPGLAGATSAPDPGFRGRELLPGVLIRTRTESGGGGMRTILDIQAREDLRQPDLLVYWSTSPAREGGVPEDAFLIGKLGGVGLRSYALPRGAPEKGGVVILYSLANGSRIASASLEDR